MLSAFTGLVMIMLAIFLTIYGAARTDIIQNPFYFVLPLLSLVCGLVLWALANIEGAIREHTRQTTIREKEQPQEQGHF